MANTYYDSQLTAAEIEEVLEAINGILNPANNGKALAINNGKLEARSVQWGGGEPTIETLSVTENGTYTAPSGVDGYSPITVNVPGSSAVVQPLNATQNGIYNPPSGVDGYAPVNVNVESPVPVYSLIPVLSSLTGPNGHVIYNTNKSYYWSSAGDVWKAFDGDKTNYGQYFVENQNDFWIGYEFHFDTYIDYVLFYGDNYSAGNSFNVDVEYYDENDNEWKITDSFVQAGKDTTAKKGVIQKITKSFRLHYTTLKVPATNIFTREIEAFGFAPEISLQSKVVTTNGLVLPDSGYDGLSRVTVNVSGGGGSSNILSGILTPNAGVGDNGDIYLQHVDSYLFSDGNCSIDTGISALNVYGFSFIFEPTRIATPYQTYLGATTDNFTIGQITNINTIYIRRRTGEDLQSSVAFPCIIEYINGEIFVGDVKKGTYDNTLPVCTQNTNVNIFSGVNGARKSAMRFYVLKLYDINNNAIFDGIPAYNNGVACVYDRISESYIIPSGTVSYEYDGSIISSFAKVNGSWQKLIGTDINDINLGGN